MRLMAILLLVAPFILSCSKQTPYDFVYSEIKGVSHGKYILDFCGCSTDYYINGGHYFDLPKLTNGLYLSYVNSYDNSLESYPMLDYVDDREGIFPINALPIKSVKKIAFGKDGYFVDAEGGSYFVGKNKHDLPEVVKINNYDEQLSLANKEIQFDPVVWPRKALGNYKNYYFSLEDTSVKGYQPGQTPKIECIKTAALYSKYSHKKGKEINYLVGERTHSYFLLNISSGKVSYFDKSQFVSVVMKAHKNGNLYFVNSAGFYLKDSDLQGLKYVKHYKVTFYKK